MHRAALQHAQACLAENRLDEAHEVLAEVLREDPENVTGLMLTASVAAKRGKLSEAERLLRRSLISLNEATVALAWVLIQRNRPRQALDLFSQVLERDPSNDQAASLKAWVLTQVGEVDDALNEYGKLIARRPRDPALKVNYGKALAAAGKDLQAVSSFREAIKIDPSSGDAWWALANLKTVQLTDSEVREISAQLSNAR